MVTGALRLLLASALGDGFAWPGRRGRCWGRLRREHPPSALPSDRPRRPRKGVLRSADGDEQGAERFEGAVVEADFRPLVGALRETVVNVRRQLGGQEIFRA